MRLGQIRCSAVLQERFTNGQVDFGRRGKQGRGTGVLRRNGDGTALWR